MEPMSWVAILRPAGIVVVLMAVRGFRGVFQDPGVESEGGSLEPISAASVVDGWVTLSLAGQAIRHCNADTVISVEMVQFTSVKYSISIE